MLKNRQQQILQAVIEHYIQSAKPVASQDLTQERGLDMSSATIRSEMLALDDSGYLEQPHTSAGRVPTDKGYRFFVDNLIPRLGLSEKEEQTLNSVFSIEDEEDFIRDLGKTLSRLSRTFSAIGTLHDDLLYETGFSEIFEEPEFLDRQHVKTFGHLADLLDDEIGDFVRENATEEKIFIGEENPWKWAHDYALVMSSWRHPTGLQGFFVLIGPKRTNYSKHLSLINYLKSFNDHE